MSTVRKTLWAVAAVLCTSSVASAHGHMRMSVPMMPMMPMMMPVGGMMGGGMMMGGGFMMGGGMMGGGFFSSPLGMTASDLLMLALMNPRISGFLGLPGGASADVIQKAITDLATMPGKLADFERRLAEELRFLRAELDGMKKDQEKMVDAINKVGDRMVAAINQAQKVPPGGNLGPAAGLTLPQLVRQLELKEAAGSITAQEAMLLSSLRGFLKQ